MRKTKAGDDSPSKKTGILSRRPKLPLSKKTATGKKEESAEDEKAAKTKSATSLSRPAKETTKVTSRTTADSAKKPTVKTGTKSATVKKEKPDEKLDRTSGHVSNVKTSSKLSTSPVGGKRTPKAKARSAESPSPILAKSAARSKSSDTTSRRSSLSDVSVKKDSKSSTLSPTKAPGKAVAPVTPKTKSTGSLKTKVQAKMSAKETSKEKKTGGLIGKTLSGIGQKLKSMTPRDKKERKKSVGVSSTKSGLGPKSKKTSEKALKTSPASSPNKPRRSSTSDLSSPASPTLSAKSLTKKHKKSTSTTISSNVSLTEGIDLPTDPVPVEPPVEPVPVEPPVESVPIEDVPESKPESTEVIGEDVVEEPIASPVCVEDIAVLDKELPPAVESTRQEDDEHGAADEFISLSPGSSHWSLHPSTPLARTITDLPTTVSTRSQSGTSRDALSLTATTPREASPEPMHLEETVPETEALAVEELQIVDEVKVETPEIVKQSPPVEHLLPSEESSVGAEAGSEDISAEGPPAAHVQLDKSSAESSIEVEVDSDEMRRESSSFAEDALTGLEGSMRKRDLELMDAEPETSLETNVGMMRMLTAQEETSVDKTPTREVIMDVSPNVGERMAVSPLPDAEAFTDKAMAEIRFPANKQVTDHSWEMNEDIAVRDTTQAEPKAFPMNEMRDIPTPELITSSSADHTAENVLTGSGPESLVVYHSDEGKDPVEDKDETKERLAELEDFDLQSEPAHEDKTTDSEARSRHESEPQSRSLSSSSWSSDQAFASEPMDVEDLDMTPNPSHSDDERDKTKTELIPDPAKQKTAAPVHHKEPEPQPNPKSPDLQDYIKSDTYAQHLAEDPIDEELMAETRQPREYIPSPPHDDDPEEDPSPKGKRGNRMVSCALYLLGGLGGLAVTFFLLRKRGGV